MMKKNKYDRRKFIGTTVAGSIGFSMANSLFSLHASTNQSKKRVGIIGLDTSHSIAFTKALNTPDAMATLGGYKVVAAYPKGSNDIESSTKRIPGYTEEVKTMGVEIVGSINEL
ncbi:MAG TPA: gfo/Idh/MocA family oxidoreductase, partial [Agriterribacter sp.]|nr:gfo/Idh/MocA family oxidoreductase [Agriterribacter sp.]